MTQTISAMVTRELEWIINKRGRPLSKKKASTITGRLVREKRVEGGLTLKNIADKLGVSLAYISNVESGHPLALTYVNTLSKILRVKNSALVEAILRDSDVFLTAQRVIKKAKITIEVK